MAPKKTESTEVLVERFLTSRRAAGLSLKSIRDGYGTPIRFYLLPFLEREGLTLAELDQAAMDRLNVAMLERVPKLSKNSIASYVRHINVFLRWSEKYGGATVRAVALKPQKRAREVLTREELKRMEDSCQTERDKLIVRLAADTGMRLGELAGINIADLGADAVKVSGKTGERFVSLSPRLSRRLRAYAVSRPRGVITERLFISLRRKDGAYEPLAAPAIYSVIKSAADMAGIQRRVYPHLIRHSYITHALARGANPIFLTNQVGVSLGVIASNYHHPSMRDRHRAAMSWLEEEEE